MLECLKGIQVALLKKIFFEELARFSLAENIFVP